MDASARANAINSLEISSDRLEFWLHVSTLLVVIGLVVEVWEISKEHREKGTLKTKAFFWAVAGALLITIGVAGELWVGIKVAEQSSKLRDLNRETVALLNVEAGKARREAETAHSESAGAIKSVEDAKKDNLELGIALAKQQERAAVAEKAFLELQKAMAPRTLDVSTFFRFKERLRNAPFKGRISMSVQAGDAEAYAVALQIAGALNESGWSALVQQNMGGASFGIDLSIHTSKTADVRRGYELEKALKETGLEFRAKNIPEEGEGSVVLHIGTKPMPTVTKQ